MFMFSSSFLLSIGNIFSLLSSAYVYVFSFFSFFLQAVVIFFPPTHMPLFLSSFGNIFSPPSPALEYKSLRRTQTRNRISFLVRIGIFTCIYLLLPQSPRSNWRGTPICLGIPTPDTPLLAPWDPGAPDFLHRRLCRGPRRSSGREDNGWRLACVPSHPTCPEWLKHAEEKGRERGSVGNRLSWERRRKRGSETVPTRAGGKREKDKAREERQYWIVEEGKTERGKGKEMVRQHRRVREREKERHENEWRRSID